MKKSFLFLLAGLALLMGCAPPAASQQAPLDSGPAVTVTDGADRLLTLPEGPKRVFALSSSFAEIWLLAGGELAAVTSDALDDRGLGLPEDILVLGTVKDPNAELILSAQADFIILSQDVASHAALSEILQQAEIPHYMAKAETLDDYLKVLTDFSAITGNGDSLQQNGQAVRAQVDALLARLPAGETQKTALFLRAFSSDVRVKARDHTVCYILQDIGVSNIAQREGFPLEELSVEAIVQADPDYIFIVAMGDEQAAERYLTQSLYQHPAWAGLTAVQNGNAIVLSKDLYHYKPNNRWGEAYETILEIVYPGIYAQG